ncbi:hypothetical protein C8F04DRAFT_1255544 [Mycena alexandri]|uniref:Uncharacterized protein n=1 Tax=Mycena alexandri TaxID=1745969 RepID=A0AAD6T727_9AGAR|nr:hypothetical protein C8F04DRAFT_1255544 [Mycena alexandri]
MQGEHRRRKSKGDSAARSNFLLNPEFGHLNSQVKDRNAFRVHLGAPAGPETQRELQAASQHTADPADIERGPDIPDIKLESPTKAVTVKVEKENIVLSAPTTAYVARTNSSRLSAKRARIDEVKSEDLGAPHSTNESLRISQLEREVASLRREIQVIQDLRREWEGMRHEYKTLRVRVGFVEDHVDELALRVPALSPDALELLPICDNGSQPVDEDYSQAEYGVDDMEVGAEQF